MSRRVNLDMQDEEAGVDMTPMLDIVFIMLIFFIVSTSFVREAGVEVERPVASSAERPETQGVMLAITEQGQFWLDHNMIDKRMLRPMMERLRVEQPGLGVMIQADKGSHTGTLIEVLDILRLMGIEQVAVAARPGSS